MESINAHECINLLRFKTYCIKEITIFRFHHFDHLVFILYTGKSRGVATIVLMVQPNQGPELHGGPGARAFSYLFVFLQILLLIFYLVNANFLIVYSHIPNFVPQVAYPFL